MMTDDNYSDVEARARVWRERIARAYSEWWRGWGDSAGRDTADGRRYSGESAGWWGGAKGDDWSFDTDGNFDDYAVIGCSRHAIFDELRRGYRRAAKRLHPDARCGRAASEAEVRMATNRMAALNAAWERICASMGVRG